VLIYFKLVSCEEVSDCSGHGICTGPNMCVCESGFKSIGCSQGKVFFSVLSANRPNVFLMDVNNDNSFAAGCVLIKTKIVSFALKQNPSIPPNLMMEVKTIWELACFK